MWCPQVDPIVVAGWSLSINKHNHLMELGDCVDEASLRKEEELHLYRISFSKTTQKNSMVIASRTISIGMC